VPAAHLLAGITGAQAHDLVVAGQDARDQLAETIRIGQDGLDHRLDVAQRPRSPPLSRS
jgi:hypothetical protein